MAKILTSQPFPFKHYDVATGDMLPCGTSSGSYIKGALDQMMRAYWRVRKYQMTFTFTTTPLAYGGPTTESCTLEAISYLPDQLKYTETEEELVCQASLYIDIISKTSRITDVSANFSFGGADFYVNSLPDPSMVKLYFDSFYFQNDNDDYPGISISPDGTFGPVIFDAYQVYNNSGQELKYASDPDLMESVSATITPTLFWGYNGIWDTNTGIKN